MCGAACAQIVLASLGHEESEKGQTYREGYLAQMIWNNSTYDTLMPWVAAPDGIRWVLERHRPAHSKYHIELVEAATEEALSRKLIWALHTCNKAVPQPVLVFGTKHWLVVIDYDV